MSRQKGLSRAYASVSLVAVFGVLAGCSQPASYATVDMGGSYGNGAPQAYSGRSGLPVYQSTQVYTTPAAPQNVGQPQYVYQDAPINQVASISPGFGGYSQPLPQSYSAFETIVPDATVTGETILESNGYINVGPYGGVQTAALTPGTGSIGFESAPILSDVPQYLPAPVAVPQTFEALPYSAPVVSELLPPPAPLVQDYTNVAYSAPSLPSYTVEAPQAAPAPVYEPLVAQIPTAPYALPEAIPAPAPIQVAALPSLPARDDVNAVRGYYDFGAPSQQAIVQEAALPAPTAVAPAPRYTPPSNVGITLPSASQAYPRPYEALRPGFFPSYEFPSGGALLSEVVTQPAPVQVVELIPQQVLNDALPTNTSVLTTPITTIEQASVAIVGGSQYTISPGDTLYSIARMHGVTPLAIAEANSLPMAGTIYAGNTLTIPTVGGGSSTLGGDAPVVVLQTAEVVPSVQPFRPEAASINTYTTDLTDQSVEMIDIEELARMFRDRETGQSGASIPVISAEAGAAMRGRTDLTPTEVLSEPVAIHGGSTVIMPMSEVSAIAPAAFAKPRYSWPVHGDVFSLNGGGIEIAAPAGQVVAASASGQVVHVEDGPRGMMIVVEHADGWRSITLGVRNAGVQVGQSVTAGQTLGYTDGSRIMFELRDNTSNVAEVLSVLRG